MATQGPNAGSSFASSGSPAWTNPGNAIASDNIYATVVINTSSSNFSGLLNATGFGFSIPAGSTINGILVEAEGKAVGSTHAGFSACQLIRAGVVENHAGRTATPGLTSSDAFNSMGGSADLWDTSWSVSDINNSGFGVAIVGNDGRPKEIVTVSVDFIRITITYTAGATNKGNMLLVF